MNRIRIRGGSGLGDALYVQSAARHLIELGHEVEACSNYPDVFRSLNGKCIASPFRRDSIDRLVHYSQRRLVKETDQFRDCCIQAGLKGKVDLRLDWSVKNVELYERVKSAAWGRPIIVVQLPRLPMNRQGYEDLLPDCRALQRAIDGLHKRGAFVVQVGSGAPKFTFSGIDLDLANQTSVSDLIDAVFAADICLGYVSFLLPLAESLSKPTLMVWSRKNLNSTNSIMRTITPEKIIHRRDLVQTVMDDCQESELNRVVDAVLAQVRSSAAV